MSKVELIMIERIPTSVDDLKTLSAAKMSTPFQTAALAVAAFCNYENNSKTTIEMINYLKGPEDLSQYDIQFIRDRLLGKGYVVRSYIEGTTTYDNYKLPNPPYQIEVSENMFSYKTKTYATLYLKSSGADNPRPVTLRQKDDTWFLWHHTFLSDIRPPRTVDHWG